MRCERCGHDFAAGLSQCPHCGTDIHYNGKTVFFGKAAASKLTIKDLFTDMFKRHSAGAGARMFMAGTPLSTPAPGQMLQEWEKPWLFTRLLAVGLAFSLLSYVMAISLGHPLGIYLLFTLGALVIPLGILTFFWEINIPRDIPIYKVLLIFFIGGMLSLIITLVLPSVDGPSYWAAISEEPAKVIALAIFMWLLGSKYIFGGLLIGAAVGAGFSAFENIYYVMNVLLSSGSAEMSMDLLITRSVLTIGGHVTWAAIEGGALALAKGTGKLQPRHFIDPRFLTYLAASIVLHFIWNTEITLVSLPVVADLKYVLLCALAVAAVFTLIKKALSQVLAVVDGAQFTGGGSSSGGASGGGPRPQQQAKAAAAPGGALLRALSGPLAGAYFSFQKAITIGRDPAVCNVILPPDTPGVSRCHCSLELRDDGVYLVDRGYSSGTFLSDGRRLPPDVWVRLEGPFALGSAAVRFSAETGGSKAHI